MPMINFTNPVVLLVATLLFVLLLILSKERQMSDGLETITHALFKRGRLDPNQGRCKPLSWLYLLVSRLLKCYFGWHIDAKEVE